MTREGRGSRHRCGHPAQENVREGTGIRIDDDIDDELAQKT
jgi:hypothetical protein